MAYEEDRISQSTKEKFDHIKNLIENGFMHEWAISIEYAVRTHQSHSEWIRWDKTLFDPFTQTCHNRQG